MTLRQRMTWLFAVVACAAMVAGCGSASTGHVSADAVFKTAHDFAGPHAKVGTDGLLVMDPGSKKVNVMWIFYTCKPEGGCEWIAPDGVAYPNLRAFVDDTEFLKPGATVSGHATMTAPGKPGRDVSLTKHARTPWNAYAGIGGLLLALLILAGMALILVRGRRAKDGGAVRR